MNAVRAEAANPGNYCSQTRLTEKLDSDYRFHPLYGMAMLKVSFRLRPGNRPGFDHILGETLRGIEIDENELDKFIELHLSKLERRCKEVGI